MAPVRNDEPAVLEVGQEVSAKFNGAFCEAKIRAVSHLDVRVKVRDSASGETYTVKHSDVRSELKDVRIQNTATVKPPSSNESVVVNVLQVLDYSQYEVEFNDGDKKNLRRTSLHPKSGKHFDESTSLDNMPLTQPEKASAAQTAKEGSVASSARSKRRNSPSGSEASDESESESVRRSTRSRRTTVVGSRPVGRPKREKQEGEPESLQTEKDSPEDSPKKGRPPRKPVASDKPSSSAQVTNPPPVVPEVRTERRQSKPTIKEEPHSSPSRSPPRKRVPVVEAKVEPAEKATAQVKEATVKSAVSAKNKEGERDEKDASTARSQREKRGREESREAVSPPKKVTPNIPGSSSAVEPRKTEAVPKQEPGLDADYPLKSIVCVPQNGRKKFKWLPGLVVHPECRKKGGRLDTSKELLVRLFSSGNFVKVLKSQVKPFSESLYSEPEEDRIQTFNPDYALLYFRDQSLPPTWQPTLFVPFDQHEGTDEGDDGEDSGGRDDPDDESEANRFMIQFIKYRDESGHPYDGEPTVLGKTVDMYKLYREVHHVGGFNRCTQESKWPEICGALSISRDGADSLKNIYQTHFHGGFETFFRTLASSISDIRLGRKRHQYTSQEVHPTEPVRPKPAEPALPSSPQPAPQPVKRPPPGRPRGRPPGSTKTEKAPSKEKSTEPIRDEPKMPSTSQPVVKNEKPDDVKPATADTPQTTTAKSKVAPPGPETLDLSKLRSGAVVEVLYHNKKTKKVLAYNARILDNVGDIAYYVHYAHWNKRYDEWIPLKAVIKIVDTSEIGFKQYVFNPSMQVRNRNKLKGPEWNKWRQALDAALGETSPSPQQTISTDQSSTKSGSEVREDAGSRPEPKPRVSQKRSASKTDEERTKSESDSKQEREPKVIKLDKAASPGVSKPVKVVVEPEKTVKEIAEKGKGAETVTVVTAEPVSEPKPVGESVQKRKVVAVDKSSDPSRHGKKEVKPVAESVPAAPSVVPPEPQSIVQLQKTDKGVEEKEKEVQKNVAAAKTIPKIADSSALPSNQASEVEKSPAPVTPAKRGRPSNKSKQLKLEQEKKSKELVAQPTVEPVTKPADVPLEKLPEPQPTASAPADAETPRKRGRSKKVSEIDHEKDVAVEPTSNQPVLPTAPLQPPSAKVQFADNLQLLAAVAVPAIVVDTVTEQKEEKSSTGAATKEKKPSARKRKVPVEISKDILLSAPAFAAKHRAALERLKLPLDGSEGSGETVFEEDECGNSD
ncbi:AT-rich interactive domain-containing protein 4B-like [Paramacrobiotus metropolitanus]|uniref:AT-rich interactive domain-containing protein 4B-like n=1 Tax=Paramacrobiotus metropolitanus TaxID=2943436 RepID=UPI002445A97A|nr:AT-rich interactive domain-containing protein 4B-like [Paramacrobiotus metropolitanus]